MRVCSFCYAPVHHDRKWYKCDHCGEIHIPPSVLKWAALIFVLLVIGTILCTARG